MNKKILKTILVLLAIWILAIIVMENSNAGSNISNVSIGVASSALVVFLLEILAFLRDSWKYSFLRGHYERLEIVNALDTRTDRGIYDRDFDEGYKEKGIKLGLELKYLGNGEYKGPACYEQGKAVVTINLNLNNPQIGNGVYQYLEKKPGYEMPDLGTYTVQVDIDDKSKIYIYYQNVIPNGLARGYEIWKKI